MVLARFLRSQIALTDRPPVGCVQLNDEEATLCAEALDESAIIEKPTEVSDAQSSKTALDLAILFHDTYERLAPQFGYETRPETRTFSPSSKNGQLMRAVCEELLGALRSSLVETFDEHDAGIIRDLEAMAKDQLAGFWPQALAIGALRLIRRAQKTDEKCEHGLPRRFCTAVHS